MSRQIESN